MELLSAEGPWTPAFAAVTAVVWLVPRYHASSVKWSNRNFFGELRLGMAGTILTDAEPAPACRQFSSECWPAWYEW